MPSFILVLRDCTSRLTLRTIHDVTDVCSILSTDKVTRASATLTDILTFYKALLRNIKSRDQHIILFIDCAKTMMNH